MANTIQISVNGETQTIPSDTSVAAWVESLGMHANQVAVEVNQELVPRTEREATVLRAGDRIEMVTLVGGG